MHIHTCAHMCVHTCTFSSAVHLPQRAPPSVTCSLFPNHSHPCICAWLPDVAGLLPPNDLCPQQDPVLVGGAPSGQLVSELLPEGTRPQDVRHRKGSLHLPTVPNLGLHIWPGLQSGGPQASSLDTSHCLSPSCPLTLALPLQAGHAFLWSLSHPATCSSYFSWEAQSSPPHRHSHLVPLLRVPLPWTFPGPPAQSSPPVDIPTGPRCFIPHAPRTRHIPHTSAGAWPALRAGCAELRSLAYSHRTEGSCYLFIQYAQR